MKRGPYKLVKHRLLDRLLKRHLPLPEPLNHRHRPSNMALASAARLGRRHHGNVLDSTFPMALKFAWSLRNLKLPSR